MSGDAHPGGEGSGRAEVSRILEEEGLPPGFPPDVEEQVEAMLASPGIDDPTLVSLEHMPFVTVDGPGSRDLDQALFIERDGDGFVVRYAIADASYFVRPQSPLFREALRRGASYYVPGRAVPMLPPAMSEGIVSLNPGVARRAVVFVSRLDAEGRCLSTEVVRGRIRSRAKLTFGGVQAFLDGAPGKEDIEGQAFADSLRLLQVVGQQRQQDQALRQVIRYRRVEVDIMLDTGADALMAVVGSRGDVERYNEQLSLLCNSEGGRLLSRDDEGPVAQGIYRAHPAPPPSRLHELEELIEGMAELHRLPDAWLWRQRGERGLSEYLSWLPEGGPHRRVSLAIQRQAVMTNLRSSYTETPASHHGVGARPYARFSAPMREVVGVFVHKELMEKLGFAEPMPPEQDEALRELVIESAARARELQARLDERINRAVIDRLLSRDLARDVAARPVRVATVMGLTATKVHVQLDEPPLDLKVYRQDLERSIGCPTRVAHGYAALLDGAGLVRLLVGREVKLRVASFDEQRDRWMLEIVP